MITFFSPIPHRGYSFIYSIALDSKTNKAVTFEKKNPLLTFPSPPPEKKAPHKRP